MEQHEIEHRDQVLRNYFRGRTWDQNGEYILKRQLVLNSDRLLQNYPYLIEDEWEAKPGRTDKGRGDLVFTDGKGRFAIVEVKWIDHDGKDRNGSSKTRRESNRRKRRKVEKQTSNYATLFVERACGLLGIIRQVEAYIFTNDYNQPHLLETKNFDELT